MKKRTSIELEILGFSLLFLITFLIGVKGYTLKEILRVIIATCFVSVALFIFVKIRNHTILKTVTKPHRGTKSERNLVIKLLKHRFSSEFLFHDLYLKKQNGEFSQIDLVLLTSVGVIVFEVKDFSGWIYGNGNQSHWTKVLAYGKNKYRFYNPVMQNIGHIQDLKKEIIQLSDIPFYSVIVFYGDCVLKEVNFVPTGTFLAKSSSVLDVIKVIEKENEPVYFKNINDCILELKKAVLNGENKEIQKQHIENINDMLGKDRIFE